MNKNEINEVILKVFVILFSGFILFTVILPFTPKCYKQLSSQILSISAFLLGCYLLKEIFRIKKAERLELFAENVTDKVVNFWILITVTYFLFFASVFFLLMSLNTPSYILMIALIVPNYGFAFAIIVYAVYKRRSRRKIRLRFSKQRLPIAIIDLILAAIFFFIAGLTGVVNLKHLLVFTGVLFSALAVLNLVLRG